MFKMEGGRGSCCKLQASFKIFTAIFSLYYLNLSVLDKSLHLSCWSWSFSFRSSCSWERLVEVLQITSNWIGMYVKCDIAHEQLPLHSGMVHCNCVNYCDYCL